MRKFYDEFFYVPKHGKIREKVMLVRVAMIIAVMIVCLVAMSFTAYAYFSCNITSGFNTIKAATFEAQITINNGAVPVTEVGDVYTAELTTAGNYTVKLAQGESTAKTGFCIVTIGETEYYTQQIGVDGDKMTPSVTFTLNVPGTTTVKIRSHWGTSSRYGYADESNNPLYIRDNDNLDLTTPTGGADGSSSEGEPNTAGTTTATGDVTGTTTTTTTETTPPSTTVTDPADTTGTTDLSTSTTQQAETTSPSTTVTDPADTTGTTESTTTQQTETTTAETTGAPTTEASES